MRKKYTEDEIDFLIKNYSIHGAEYCSQIIQHPLSSVKDKVCNLKLKINPEVKKNNYSKASVGRNVKNIKDNFKVNPEIFFEINTPELAYILGIFWADGYITKSKYGDYNQNWMYLVKEDMVNIKWIFDKVGEWNYYSRQPKKGREQMAVFTNNKFIGQFLLENNYKNKSKGADLILSKIPTNLKKYFLRGVIDGDGNFHMIEKLTYSFHVVGPYDQNWNYIESIFKELKIKYKIKQSSQRGGTQRCSRIFIYNREGIIKLGNFIYEGFEQDKIGLNRKFDKFLQIKKTLTNHNSRNRIIK